MLYLIDGINRLAQTENSNKIIMDFDFNYTVENIKKHKDNFYTFECNNNWHSSLYEYCKEFNLDNGKYKEINNFFTRSHVLSDIDSLAFFKKEFPDINFITHLLYSKDIKKFYWRYLHWYLIFNKKLLDEKQSNKQIDLQFFIYDMLNELEVIKNIDMPKINKYSHKADVVVNLDRNNDEYSQWWRKLDCNYTDIYNDIYDLFLKYGKTSPVDPILTEKYKNFVGKPFYKFMLGIDYDQYC